MLFGFRHVEFASNLMMIMGAGTILYSMLTAYEAGLSAVLPFTAHLVLDVISGLLLLAAPWLFGFANEVTGPFVAIGLFELVAVFCTNRQPSDRPIATSR
jgi:hypothetical protein